MRLPYTKTNINYELSKAPIATETDNALSVITDRLLEKESSTSSGLVDYFQADLVSSSDYYPFGMAMGGRGKAGPADAYRYGFNGKEKDDEFDNVTGSKLDFGARIYDSRLGRFLSVDKFANRFAYQSPYLFAGNTPISGIDVNGDSLYIMNSSGQILNITSTEGKVYANQFGYSTLMRTITGRELLNKYQNSSTHDVYITVGKTSSPNRGAETTSLPLSSNGNSKAVFAEGTLKGEMAKFNGITLKNPSSTFSLMVFNQDYLNSNGIFSEKDIYDKSESFFHELKSHVDLAIKSIEEYQRQVADDPTKANDKELIGKIQHSLYGVNHYSNLGLSGHTVTPVSFAATIRSELSFLKSLDKSLQEIIKVKRDNTNVGSGGDAADGIGF